MPIMCKNYWYILLIVLQIQMNKVQSFLSAVIAAVKEVIETPRRIQNATWIKLTILS